MALSAAERETIIRFDEEDDVAHVYTTSRPTITKLKANPAAKLLGEGLFERSAWAEFELPKALVSFRTKRGTRTLTDEQRQAAADRLKAARTRA